MNVKKLLAICGTSGAAALCGCSNATDGNAHFTEEDQNHMVQLGDDFYEFSNGGWMKQHPLPADKSRIGAFDILADDNDNRLKLLVEEAIESNSPHGSTAQKIADLYACSMDTVQRDADEFKAFAPYFEMIDSMKTATDIARTMATLEFCGVPVILSFGSTTDAGNSSQCISAFWQTGIGLPDRDFYFNSDEKSESIRAEYKTMLNTFAEYLGWENARERVNAIYNFEETLASKMYTRKQNRDPQATYNKRTYSEFKEQVTGIEWDTYFEVIGIVPEEIDVSQIDYAKQVGDIIGKTDIATLADYMKMRIVRGYANHSSTRFVDASFAFYGKTLSGMQEKKPLWKRSLNVVNSIVGEQLGQLFVEKYFPQAAKTRMQELIENLRTAFGQRIDNLTWMGDTTKVKAKEKLASITVKVGYPDKWTDYSALEINKESGLIGNIISAYTFEMKRDLERIGKPVDRSRWYMTPQTVNAYYEPTANEIVFPAGILQPPFFYADGDDAVNYGAIGVVIGHEMTHGFDDQGCQFDKDGNLKNWWTETDAEQFKAATSKLVDRYSSFIAVDDIHANGELTLGENIADLGGLNIAYQAYHNALGEKEAQLIDGQTGDQRFCYAYSRIWAANYRKEAIFNQVKTDPHSPARLRVNVPLPLVDYFYSAFGITEKDSMFVAKDDRIVIW